jgi:chemotaxis protein methyltransferase CheR
MRPDSFDRLGAFLMRRSGHLLGADKLYLVQARLRPILATSGIPDLDRLVDRISAEPNGPLGDEVVEAMTTNETLFFRDLHPFTDLAEQVVPRLVASRPKGTTLRFWSAAASFGQEAYTLAMVLTELRWMLGDRRVEIIGTDIAEAALKRARQATYTDFEVQRGLSPARCAAHMHRSGIDWRVNDSLRAMASFRQFNLLNDMRPLGRFDVILCRNVLIYFDQPTKTRVLTAIARQLAPDGVLYLGGSETLLGLNVGLRKLDRGRGGFVVDPAFAAETLVTAL